ncbi:MAG: hypothetical protein ACFFBV_14660 [Promethearchaeota archaeon]
MLRAPIINNVPSPYYNTMRIGTEDIAIGCWILKQAKDNGMAQR